MNPPQDTIARLLKEFEEKYSWMFTTPQAQGAITKWLSIALETVAREARETLLDELKTVGDNWKPYLQKEFEEGRSSERARVKEAIKVRKAIEGSNPFWAMGYESGLRDVIDFILQPEEK